MMGVRRLSAGIDFDGSGKSTPHSDLGAARTGQSAAMHQQLHRFTVTPDVQILINQTLDPDADVVGVFGLRAWLVL